MMSGKGLVDSPFAVPDSLFLFVIRAFHLLRERGDFAHFCDAVNGRLAVELAMRAAPVVVELPLFNSLVNLVFGRGMVEPELVQVSQL